MRKFATIAAGVTLAAGVVLVPSAGFASAATTHSPTSASAPVTHTQPRDVDVWQCQDGGGQVGWVGYDYSPSGYLCFGGWYDGQVVWW